MLLCFKRQFFYFKAKLLEDKKYFLNNKSLKTVMHQVLVLNIGDNLKALNLEKVVGDQNHK